MRSFLKGKGAAEQFPALTGIRAVAAFMVFFNHLSLWLKPDFFIGLQLCFFYGVTIFFVLSGFLITYRYFDKMQFSKQWLRRYFVNRFARIYPVYFLLLTIVVLINRQHEPVFLFQNYTLLHNLEPFIHSHGAAIGPSWSLTVEECFYLSAPVIMYLTLRFGLWLPALAMIGLIAITVRLNGELSLHHQYPMLYTTLWGNFVAFFSGIYLALRVRRNDQAGIKKAKGLKWTALGLVSIMALTLPMVYATNKPDSLKIVTMLLTNNVLLPFPIAALYYGLVYERTWISRLLAGRIANLLGKSSYAFYLMHWPLILIVGGQILKQPYFAGHHNCYVLFMFVLCLILSILLFLCYEEPLRKLIRRWNEPAGEPAL